MVLLDIDRIPELMARSGVASYNRFNWASFDDRDHLGDPKLPLRERLFADAEKQGVPIPDGPVFLLTHLRYFGYCFNPISFYYFSGAQNKLTAVMAEVHNTFGESRNYWLWEGNGTQSDTSLRFRCPKTLHVSPFLGMNLHYDFALTPPEGRLVAHIVTSDDCDPMVDATLTLDREEWTAANLRRALIRQPWMTAKVIAAIHWQALRLWMKQIPIFAHPDQHRAE